jgi:hypothetical protein
VSDDTTNRSRTQSWHTTDDNYESYSQSHGDSTDSTYIYIHRYAFFRPSLLPSLGIGFMYV